ncbi:DEAD/DEAH box helicase family protein [Paenibacillus elgii]|uniref:DEAD/DEAH box helicase family protein n=1 Tax=Paenibacillus elgii TaxID=189691 RepID=UPI0013D4C6ED|nr:DEAD/DEAH box helicase family protein [Paenibacillus elgii]
MNKLPVIQFTMNTSENDLIKEFYEPCLKWAKYYDRGVGYFTSGWIQENAKGLSHFIYNGGKARWLVSPILDENDHEALLKGMKAPEDIDLIQTLKSNIVELQKHMEIETKNAIGWMIYDGIIEFRFAMPTNHLINGDFHDKFGIFYDDCDNALSFNGSVNDSVKGMINYESIKIFPSWLGLSNFVEDDIKRFERLWNNYDVNVITYQLPDAVKEDIFKLRTSERPYKLVNKKLNLWRHQDEAVEIFMNKENGVLEMATGTGKTRTAIRIINELLSQNLITTVFVTVSGTDLLDQWYTEIISNINLAVFRYYEQHKDLAEFILCSKQSLMLVSRDFLAEVIDRLDNSIISSSLIICDEVHGFGSPTVVKQLKGKVRCFKYRLGLSATPEREYDEEGNSFIEQELGAIIFRFPLEEAIRRRVLCEFEYVPLEFELTDEDRKKMKNLIGVFNTKLAVDKQVSPEELYRELSKVKKTSGAKIPIFYKFLLENPGILKRSIVFVETKDYGKLIQQLIIRFQPNFHTYYGDDDRYNLERFSNGELDCLITCKRISEGIDILSVNNIILLSTDRAKIQTIQRIGRCLRLDKNNPDKRPVVVDFIMRKNVDAGNENNTDEERKEWLTKISQIRWET